ncbi:hypothetical protein C8F01DRAFT_1101319 [Mycena amicta]|nr:hypothetical protein C8F01DRAFT_1101319 [Mycena amicta]
MSDPPKYNTNPFADGLTAEQQRNYAPRHNRGDPSIGTSLSMLSVHRGAEASSSSTTLYDAGATSGTNYPVARTPSPTQSEFNALHGIKEQRSTKDLIIRYAIIAVLVAVVVVLSIENNKIIKALAPVTTWLKDNNVAGPLVIIVILVVISFPPLFGHEIVAMLAGVTWSLPVAFLIIAAGTLLGEIANFFTFKYCCGARAEKLEKSKLSYALLAHVVRQGGFIIVLVIRYSAIPSHFSTVIFSTCGVSFWVFLLAAVLSLPQSLVPVYVGYAMDHKNTKSNTIENIILAISIVITIAALRYIRALEEKAKPEVIYARRKARQNKILRDAAGESKFDLNTETSYPPASYAYNV